MVTGPPALAVTAIFDAPAVVGDELFWQATVASKPAKARHCSAAVRRNGRRIDLSSLGKFVWNSVEGQEAIILQAKLGCHAVERIVAAAARAVACGSRNRRKNLERERHRKYYGLALS